MAEKIFLARFDGKCQKCGGRIQRKLTQVRHSREAGVTGTTSHAECWYSKPEMQRDVNGNYIPGTVPVPQPIKRNGVLSGTSYAPSVPQGGGIPIEEPRTPEPYREEPFIEMEPREELSTVQAAPDALSATLAAAVLPHLHNQIKINMAEVSSIVQKSIKDAGAAVQSLVDSSVQKALENHTRTIIIEDKSTGEAVRLDGLFHKQFDELFTLCQAGINVWLHGPAGGGKTKAAEQVAEALKRRFGHISLNRQSQPSLVMGYKTAHGEYMRTEFREVYENGGVFLLDEIGAANGNFLTSMNTALANNSCAFADKIVPQHENAVFIGADNTCGLGGNTTYNTREQVDAATRERFVFLDWQYDTDLERKAALAYNPSAARWVTWVQSTRAVVERLGVKLVVSPRASIMGARLLKMKKFMGEHVADLVLFKGIDRDTRSKVLMNSPVPSGI